MLLVMMKTKRTLIDKSRHWRKKILRNICSNLFERDEEEKIDLKIARVWLCIYMARFGECAFFSVFFFIQFNHYNTTLTVCDGRAFVSNITLLPILAIISIWVQSIANVIVCVCVCAFTKWMLVWKYIM